MFKDKDEYIASLNKTLSFEEKRVINWAFRYMGKEQANEYLDNQIAGKKEKEEKVVKVKNKEEVI